MIIIDHRNHTEEENNTEIFIICITFGYFWIVSWRLGTSDGRMYYHYAELGETLWNKLTCRMSWKEKGRENIEYEFIDWQKEGLECQMEKWWWSGMFGEKELGTGVGLDE